MIKEVSFKATDKKLLALLKKVIPFAELNEKQLSMIAGKLTKLQLDAGDRVFQETDFGKESFIIESGKLLFTKMGRPIKHFGNGDFFGEIAMIDERNRMGTVEAVEKTVLYKFSKEILLKLSKTDPEATTKIYRGFSKMLISYLREEVALYDDIEVLLVQDGGCAPGYNPVTAFLTEYLEKAEHGIYIAREGFRSLIANGVEDYSYLVYSRRKYLTMEHLAGVFFSPPLREARGADFRSERFPEFKEKMTREQAAKNLKERNVKIIIGIGGNGTFKGIKDLSDLLPDVRFFFIPVTIDSDILGTETIGQHTGVEVGAEKIRSYLADARTHDRLYFIEMMGRDGGFHALHACLGAGAHLAVLPGAKYDYAEIAEALNNRTSAVVTVAEGFEKEMRKETGYIGNAAEYFRLLLVQNGLKTNRRIVCEPFSRDIRGAAPNNMDISLALRLSSNLVELIENGKDRVMPATLTGKDYDIPFTDIKTDNTVAKSLAHLSNRLIPKLNRNEK